MSGIHLALLGNFFTGGSGATYTVVQRFLATGTWTAPTGVTEVEYLVVGGGGGGGMAASGIS